METRANYLLIGVFTLAVLVAGFGFVYWFSRTGVEGEKMVYRVVFDGSISGLRNGGSVLFNGIKVGEVSDLKLNPRDPRQAVASIGIDRNIPVRSDTRASLEYQGLTGIATIALKGGAPEAAALPTVPGEPPTIQAESSAIQDLAQGAREIMGRADSILRRVDGFLAENETGARNVVKNIEKFSAALGDNSDELGAFMRDASAAARRIASLSDNIDKLAGDVSQVVRAVDPDRIASFVTRMDDLAKAIDPSKVASVLDNTDVFSKGLADSTGKITAFVSDAQALASRLKEMSERLDPALTRVGEVAQAIDPQRVQRTVENVERFTDSLGRNTVHVDSLLKDAADVARKFNDMSARIDSTLTRINDVAIAVDPQKIDRTIANVDRFTESLGQNSTQVDGLLKDASDIARKFNDMTPRIDRILANVEGLTGSKEGNGLMTEVADAARSIRKLAENLDKRVAEISSGLTKFTGSGLREWEALASEGRRTLSDLDRAVKNFDRNPQRVIFGSGSGGGGSVPQYNGRR
jgi:phospholipid/cholesterol/gamma-HCH transport system substrate-binding protein